jgi:hypothetical protein
MLVICTRNICLNNGTVKSAVSYKCLINYAQCHEDVGKLRYSSSMLDVGTRWRLVVSFAHWPPYPQERATGTHWIKGWVASDPVCTLWRRENPTRTGN